ncbi:MAG: glycosyltransferase family 4 protein [Acidobacteria bacterium]|nr:glycosyltransferase family 4 protein [Acidobacteriota bacterium]
MKLGLDVSAVPPHVAGAGRYIVEIARRLPGLGLDTTLVTRRDDTRRWTEWSPEARVAPLVPNSRVSRLVYEAWRMGTSATVRGVDVWHAPHYTMPHHSTTPTVVTVHDLTFFTNPEWHERAKVGFFRSAIRYASSHAKVLICVSDLTASLLDQFVPDHAQVVVAPHGVDLERFSPDDRNDDATLAALGFEDTRFILFVGTVEPRKGLDVLLDAFREVGARDASVELFIAGQAGWGMNELTTLIGAHEFSSRIRRLGFVDDAALPALMRQAQVVAYPSRGEGFGLPVLEALACGATVVTSRDTVMEEVAGDAAILAGVGDDQELASALMGALAMDEGERLHQSNRARHRAEYFTWERSLERHQVAYGLARGQE